MILLYILFFLLQTSAASDPSSPPNDARSVSSTPSLNGDEHEESLASNLAPDRPTQSSTTTTGSRNYQGREELESSPLSSSVVDLTVGGPSLNFNSYE
jgi:hypothetical protein